MPFMSNGKRDYAKEKKWEREDKPSRLADRAERKRARRLMEKEGKAEAFDGKDVGHVKALSKGGKTTKGNLKMQSASSNRSFARNPDGSMKSENSLKERKKRAKL